MTRLAELVGYVVIGCGAILLAGRILVPLSDLARRTAARVYERILGLFY